VVTVLLWIFVVLCTEVCGMSCKYVKRTGLGLGKVKVRLFSTIAGVG